MMERTNRLAETVSSFISRRVLSLVSTASTMFSGRSDSLSKTLMVWGIPSSRTLKSSLARSPTGEPWASVTEAKTLTKRTLTLKVLSSEVCAFSLPFGDWAEASVTKSNARQNGSIEKCGTAALGCVEGTKGQSRFVSGHDFSRAGNVENKLGFRPCCRRSFAKKHFSTPRLTVTDLRAVVSISGYLDALYL